MSAGSPYARAEASARRFLLVAGLGFFSFISGTAFSAALLMRLKDRVAGGPAVLVWPIQIFFERFWLLAVLPAMIYLVLRVLPLRPLWAACAAAATGEIFLLAAQLAHSGTEGLAELGAIRWAIRVLTFALGVVLSTWAGSKGRQWAAVREQQAAEKAKSRQAEYDAFLRAAQGPVDAAVTTEAQAVGQPDGLTPKK